MKTEGKWAAYTTIVIFSNNAYQKDKHIYIIYTLQQMASVSDMLSEDMSNLYKFRISLLGPAFQNYKEDQNKDW